MANKQLTIPGMPPPAPPKPKVVSIHHQIANLQERILRLELELALLKIQLEGDKDHA